PPWRWPAHHVCWLARRPARWTLVETDESPSHSPPPPVVPRSPARATRTWPTDAAESRRAGHGFVRSGGPDSRSCQDQLKVRSSSAWAECQDLALRPAVRRRQQANLAQGAQGPRADLVPEEGHDVEGGRPGPPAAGAGQR